MNTNTSYQNGLLRRAFLKTLPVMAGYIVLGTGFGVLAYAKGLGILWPVLMSIFIYAGSMQYAAVGLLTGGTGYLTLAVTTLAVNARHLLYGLSMLGKYKNTGTKKPYLIFSLTDETYSLLVREEEQDGDGAAYYMLVSLFNQCYWVAGSLLGVLAGRLIPFSTDGIDFSLTALFITVAVEQWCETKNHRPAMAGAVCSVACILLFGADKFLFPTMLAIVIALSAPDLLYKLNGKHNGEEGGSNEY